jgi:hypothetical protein
MFWLLLYFQKNCPNKIIARLAKIRPIWSPWPPCTEEVIAWNSYRVSAEKRLFFRVDGFGFGWLV